MNLKESGKYIGFYYDKAKYPTLRKLADAEGYISVNRFIKEVIDKMIRDFESKKK